MAAAGDRVRRSAPVLLAVPGARRPSRAASSSAYSRVAHDPSTPNTAARRSTAGLYTATGRKVWRLRVAMSMVMYAPVCRPRPMVVNSWCAMPP